MPTPKPDTSPKAVARVLRELAHAGDSQRLLMPAEREGARSLADALEREAESAPTWEERVERALVPLPWYDTTSITLTRATVDAALRAAFPELAPSDD